MWPTPDWRPYRDTQDVQPPPLVTRRCCHQAFCGGAAWAEVAGIDGPLVAGGPRRQARPWRTVVASLDMASLVGTAWAPEDHA
jgi:hypothetical protein